MAQRLVFVEEWPVRGREHTVQPGTTVGRADCDIVLPDPDVSRRHAAIRRVNGDLAIEDLGSTNGTLLNGTRIEGVAKLKEGDKVQFGNTIWHLRSPDEATRLAQSFSDAHERPPADRAPR